MTDFEPQRCHSASCGHREATRTREMNRRKAEEEEDDEKQKTEREMGVQTLWQRPESEKGTRHAHYSRVTLGGARETRTSSKLQIFQTSQFTL